MKLYSFALLFMIFAFGVGILTDQTHKGNLPAPAAAEQPAPPTGPMPTPAV